MLRPQPKIDDKDESENAELKLIITTAIDAVPKEDGWAALSGVGSYISKNSSLFDPRNYGYSKLGKLIKALSYLVLEKCPFKDDLSNTHACVRIKANKK